MGKHEEALVQYQKALEVFLAVHGPEHVRIGDTKHFFNTNEMVAKIGMGIVYDEQGTC